MCVILDRPAPEARRLPHERSLADGAGRGFGAQLDLAKELDDTEKALEGCVDDMDRMQELIEKMGELQGRMDNVDMFEVDKQIEIMMSSMGFTEEDNDRLVASYSGGWQMRMSLGKILLQVSVPTRTNASFLPTTV
jgi:ATPase subunit of ABC transporter with duplicated ATPase domains